MQCRPSGGAHYCTTLAAAAWCPGCLRERIQTGSSGCTAPPPHHTQLVSVLSRVNISCHTAHNSSYTIHICSSLTGSTACKLIKSNKINLIESDFLFVKCFTIEIFGKLWAKKLSSVGLACVRPPNQGCHEWKYWWNLGLSYYKILNMIVRGMKMMLLTLLLVGSVISQGETDINVDTAERRTATAQGGNGKLFLQLFRTVNFMVMAIFSCCMFFLWRFQCWLAF